METLVLTGLLVELVQSLFQYYTPLKSHRVCKDIFAFSTAELGRFRRARSCWLGLGASLRPARPSAA